MAILCVMKIIIVFFVLYIFVKYIGHDKCVKTDKNYLIFSNTWISFIFFEIEDLFVTNGNFVCASRIMYEFVLIS